MPSCSPRSARGNKLTPFETRVTAKAADIDEHGHVNNAVWVRWIQDLASAHWYAASPPEHRDAFIWVVTRHEIDYLRAVKEGETVTGRTWVEEPPRGARFDRHMEFVGADGKARVKAVTTWAVLDRQTGRPLRVPTEVATAFLA
jgi:acyl-CoA thioester hydrolase